MTIPIILQKNLRNDSVPVHSVYYDANNERQLKTILGIIVALIGVLSSAYYKFYHNRRFSWCCHYLDKHNDIR